MTYPINSSSTHRSTFIAIPEKQFKKIFPPGSYPRSVSTISNSSPQSQSFQTPYTHYSPGGSSPSGSAPAPASAPLASTPSASPPPASPPPASNPPNSVCNERSFYPTHCPNCSYPITPIPPDTDADTNAAMSRSVPTITPIVKPSQLAHPLPPTSGTNTESPCCISAQSVTSALLSNPVAGGNFVIFRRKARSSATVLPKSTSKKSPTASQVTAAVQGGASAATALALRSASAPTLMNTASQLQVWDVVSGHGLELTPRGSVLYRGRERALESTFVNSWTSDRGTLLKLGQLAGSNREFRFALFGPGNHTSFFRTFDQCNGKGSWRKLLGGKADGGGGDGEEEKPTHIVFMELPEVLAQMVALGVRASELVGCLKQGEYGTLRLDFDPGEWTTPEDREGERQQLREKAKAWKKGWWYTARRGMGVWIS